MRIGNDCTESATKFPGLNIYDSLNWKSHILSHYIICSYSPTRDLWNVSMGKC